MTTELEVLGNEYTMTVTPLKTGGRADVHVTSPIAANLPESFAATGIVDRLRMFFDQLDAEAEARKDDPVAMVNALARMEALSADVRTVTTTIRNHAATALDEHKVRRMTIDGIATVEGTSASERTDWDDQRLIVDMLIKTIGPTVVDHRTGEVMATSTLAETILTWFRPSWRLTPIRDAGLDPDDYSTQPKDEDGKPIRTPGVRVHDNALRGQQVAK